MDFKNAAVKKAMQELYQRHRMDAVANKSYWEQLLPELPITENPFVENPTPYSIDPEVAKFCISQLRNDGYFVTSPIIPKKDLSQMEICIKKVKQKNHMFHYPLLYDIFYQVIGKLKNVLTPILG